MNIMANDILKLNSTNYCNPHGLACKYSYSTVRDQALIAANAMENYPVVREVVATKKYSVKVWNSKQEKFR